MNQPDLIRKPLRPPLRVAPIRLAGQRVERILGDVAEECSDGRMIDRKHFSAEELVLLDARLRGVSRRAAMFELRWPAAEVERVWRAIHRKCARLRNDAYTPGATSRNPLTREWIHGRPVFTPVLCAHFLSVMSREWLKPQPVENKNDKKCFKQLSPSLKFGTK